MSIEPGLKEPLKPLELDPRKTMNNFFMLFSLSEEVGKKSFVGSIRKNVEDLKKEDQLISETFNAETDKELHSKKLLEQTWREFFAEIDQTTQELATQGLCPSLKKIREMIDRQVKEKYSEKAAELLEELNEKIKPIFERLLEKGYMHYDLSI